MSLSPRWRPAVGIGLLAAASACTGVVQGDPSGELEPPPDGGAFPDGGGVGGTGPGDPNPPGATMSPAPAQFSCDGAAKPDELPLPRLSRVELGNSLRFAVELALPGEADAIFREIADTFAQYPIDERVPTAGDLKGGYSRTDQSIQQSQIDAIYSVGLAVARELTESAARFEAMLGACAADAASDNDRGCLEAFVRRWGSRVLRHPMPDPDVAFFADIAGTTPVDRGAVADVIVTILNSPRFLYRVEHGTVDAQEVSPLSAHELAARLSYQFWQTPPDDALWEAAEDGSLLTEERLGSELTRLLSSPRVASSLDEFVSEWLRLDELPSLEALSEDRVFAEFAGSPLPTDVTRAAMLEDVRSSLRHTLSTGGSVADFFNDRKAYTDDDYLAAIYDVTPWNGSGTPPEFGSEKRAGLLGRAALLATGTASTRPIHKGYLIRNALLCEQVGAPPPNAASMPPSPSATRTTREAVTALTSGGSCAGCHELSINPQGFVLEGFDALGRERSSERLFDAEGNVTASPPVDTSAAVLINDELWNVSSPAELARLIHDSKLFESCWVRHYFRFSQSRVEDRTKDGCLLEKLEKAARAGAPIAELFGLMVHDPTFKARRFQ